MKTLIIYHQIKPGVDCPDGIAAAWVAKKKYPDADLRGCHYGADSVPAFGDYDRILIVDFSFPRHTLEAMEREVKELMVIDHHKTAMDDLSGFSSAVFDMQESGATLTWKTLFPGDLMPCWLQYVRDRDLWNFDLPMSKEIHEAASFMGRNLSQIDWYVSLDGSELCKVLGPVGEKLLEPKRQRIREIAATAQPGTVLGNSALIVKVAPQDARLVSDLCSFLYTENPEYDLICTLTPDEKVEGRINLSFRSDKNGGNFDVSAVAKQLNGGGHHNAAGGWIEGSLEPKISVGPPISPR